MIKSVIDIGTNSTRLLVVEKKDHSFKELLRRTTITRLGEDLNRTGEIKIQAAERTSSVINDYRKLAESMGSESFAAFATQALREAKNASQILDLFEARTGIRPRILTGEEEAICSFLGAILDLIQDRKQRMVIDIGGGSTEIAVGVERPEFSVSTTLGSVRLMEIFGLERAADTEKISKVRSFILTTLKDYLKNNELNIQETVFVGGTATTIAAIALGLRQYDRNKVHLSRLKSDVVEQIAIELALLDSTQRSKYSVIEKERLEVISAGALIMLSVLDYFGLSKVIVSEKDILDGYLLYENWNP
jgi:exopolyphosphatase/guanosine-5'-triphosphate,3'-diphosphate pyrophosphatase